MKRVATSEDISERTSTIHYTRQDYQPTYQIIRLGLSRLGSDLCRDIRYIHTLIVRAEVIESHACSVGFLLRNSNVNM
jgi:hypothetical protein